MERTQAEKRKAGRAGANEAVKPGAVDHPKTLDFAKRLRAADAPRSWQGQAIGHLAALWAWAWRVTDDGDLSAFEAVDVAAGAKWRGDPEVFVNLLLDAKYLDRREGGLWLHDAEDHVPGYVRDRLYQRDKKSGSRDRSTDRSARKGTIDRAALASASALASDPDLPPPSLPSEAQSEVSGRRASKPQSERQGLLGEMARAWRSLHGEEPTWTAAACIGVSDLGKRLGAPTVLRRFTAYLADSDPFYKGHCLGLFIKHFDRWATTVQPEKPNKYAHLGSRIES
jgi:hypothetical protein